MSDSHRGDPSRDRHAAMLRWLTLVVVLSSFAAVLIWARSELTWERAVAAESALRSWRAQQPVLAYLVAFVVYVVMATLSIPGATVLSLGVAWLFGFWPALVLVSFASTTGATGAFLLSRYLLRDWAFRRHHEAASRFRSALQREGPFFLLSLRLTPAVPFFLINVGMGLTPISVGRFWWISQLGMLPATAVYVYAGSQAPSLGELARDGLGAVWTPARLTQLFVALTAVAVLPLAARLSLRWLQARRGKEERSKPGSAD